jgi:hypothetical protein
MWRSRQPLLLTVILSDVTVTLRWKLRTIRFVAALLPWAATCSSLTQADAQKLQNFHLDMREIDPILLLTLLHSVGRFTPHSVQAFLGMRWCGTC